MDAETLEQTLGFRIVLTGNTLGNYRAEKLVFDSEGVATVTSVSPAQEREYVMYSMLSDLWGQRRAVVVDAEPTTGAV